MKLYQGNNLDILKKLDANTVDAVVTDPPYGLSFMNKKWDYDVPSVEFWQEVLRVLKPGGHILSFGGTRTYHRMVVNMEDAGFEIRDQVAWLYGQGFPKSLNVLKSGLKKGLFCGCESNTKSQVPSMSYPSISQAVSIGAAKTNSLQSSLSEQDLCLSSNWTKPKEVIKDGEESGMEGWSDLQENEGKLYRSEIYSVPIGVSTDGKKRQLHNGTPPSNGETFRQDADSNRSSSPQRSQSKEQLYNESRIISEQSSAQTCGSCGKKICEPGLGSALKPSIEPICLARKPLEKGLSIAENVLKYGTGAMNIDGCRIGTEERTQLSGKASNKNCFGDYGKGEVVTVQGRWPANLLLDETAAEMLDAQSGNKCGAFAPVKAKKRPNNVYGKYDHFGDDGKSFIGDSGGASRFFYVAKASKRERNAGLDKFYRCDINTECEESTEQEILLLKAILELIPNLSTAECGEGISAICPKECIFTTLMAISRITELKTWNLLMRSHTKESMRDVVLKVMDGTSLAEYADNSKELMMKIGTLLDKVGSATDDVKNVTLKKLSNIKEEKDWKSLSNIHATVKPQRLMEYLITLITPPNGVVLDPFMGSGSTGVAARNLGFDFIGIELEQEYFNIAEKRIGDPNVKLQQRLRP